MNHKKNCITYWLPKLKELEIPIPDTVVADMNKIDKNFVSAMRKLFWMKKLNDTDRISFMRYRKVLETMGKQIGYPLFLRTGQTSDKNHWKDTCFVESEETLMRNAQNLVDFSIMKDLKKGFPTNIWVVRKVLKTVHIFKAFNEMPITKEFRCFIKDGEVLCIHPYWPEEAFEGRLNVTDWKEKLAKMNVLTEIEARVLKELTQRVANEFAGYWSVDWLKDRYGKWYAIDMAVGKDSYHWKGCPHA